MSAERSSNPLISVVIPVRNEESHISQCIASLLEGTYPADRMEIIVIDGCSTDNTVAVLHDLQGRYSGRIVILNNPQKIVPYALNMGIEAATGDFIARIDAHCVYPPDYLEVLARYMDEYPDVDNVGCCLITAPINDTPAAKSIAVSISHWFGVGNAQFRQSVSKPAFVDTVPFGFFRKETFKKYGLFDTDLIRNQDDEFNHRILINGGKILLVPDVKVRYFARSSIKQLWNMYFQYGYFKPLTLIKLGRSATLRQFAPLGFFGVTFAVLLAGLVARSGPLLVMGSGLLGFYALAASFCAMSYSIRQGKDLRMIFPLIWSFAAIHSGYALGYAKGIWHFWLLKRKTADVPLTR